MPLKDILFILVDYLDFQSLLTLSSTIRFHNDIWTRFLFSRYQIYNEENPKEIYFYVSTNSISITEHKKKKIKKQYNVNVDNIARIFQFKIHRIHNIKETNEYKYIIKTNSNNKIKRKLFVSYIDYQGKIFSCYYNNNRHNVEQKDINYLYLLTLHTFFNRFVFNSIMYSLTYKDLLEIGEKLLTEKSFFHHSLTSLLSTNAICNQNHDKDLCISCFNSDLYNDVELKYAPDTKKKHLLYKYKQYYIFVESYDYIISIIKSRKTFSGLIESLSNSDLHHLFGSSNVLHTEKNVNKIVQQWRDA